MENSTKIESIPYLGGDSLRRQRRGRIPLTATETSDWRRLAARRRSGDQVGRVGYRAGEGVRRNFQIFCPRLYIARPCRCDRVERLGGTEMQNCKQLLQLGVTEKFKSVAPRLKNLDRLSDLGRTEVGESIRPRITKKFWKFKSLTYQGLRVLLTQSSSNLT